MGQNKSGEQGSSNSGHHSRKPPGMEGKCMRCGRPDHQPAQKCPAKNAKCKECHKIGHFHKACQSKKSTMQRAHLAAVPLDNDDTHINDLETDNQIHKVVNHIEANKESSMKGNISNFLQQATLEGPTTTTSL